MFIDNVSGLIILANQQWTHALRNNLSNSISFYFHTVKNPEDLPLSDGMIQAFRTAEGLRPLMVCTKKKKINKTKQNKKAVGKLLREVINLNSLKILILYQIWELKVNAYLHLFVSVHVLE